MQTDPKILEALDAAYDDLSQDAFDDARTKLAAIEADHPDVPELHYLKGELALAEELPDQARIALARAVEIDPEYADAHYLIARAAEALGDREGMREHDLIVWDLDAIAQAEFASDEVQGVLQEIEGHAEEVLAELPDRFRSTLQDVPVLIAARPDRDAVEGGFDPRALGEFRGATQQERSSVEPPPVPTHIVLFWMNLIDVAADSDDLTEEVEITLLHEIAHYFGLDEDEVAELGLA